METKTNELRLMYPPLPKEDKSDETLDMIFNYIQYTSIGFGVPLTIFVILRLFYSKGELKTFHFFIGWQALADLLTMAIEMVILQIFLMDDDATSLVPLKNGWDFLSVSSTFFTAVIAMKWMSAFTITTMYKNALRCVILIPTAAALLLKIVYGIIVNSFATVQVEVEIIVSILQPLALFIHVLVTIICLIRVLRLSTHNFTGNTIRGYHKVAVGLGFKAILTALVSIIYIAYIVAGFSNPDATKIARMITKVLQPILLTFPLFNTAITCWMISGLLFKFRRSSVVDLVTTEQGRSERLPSAYGRSERVPSAYGNR